MPRAQDWLQLALLELAHVAAQEFECRGARWRGSTRYHCAGRQRAGVGERKASAAASTSQTSEFISCSESDRSLRCHRVSMAPMRRTTVMRERALSTSFASAKYYTHLTVTPLQYKYSIHGGVRWGAGCGTVGACGMSACAGCPWACSVDFSWVSVLSLAVCCV